MQPAQVGYAYGAPAQQAMAGDLFRGASRIFVKQEMGSAAMCGNEAKQRYRISVPQDDQEGEAFLYITEESDCCMRQCCPVNRALKLKVHNGPSKDYPVVQTIEKPCSCGFNCGPSCLRPKFTGIVKDPMYVVGSIDDPCTCCFKGQKVMGQRGDEMFSVSGGICQWGLFCPCCGPVSFDASKGGTTVGGVERKTLECREMGVRTNRFIVDFGSISDPQERRMMLASAMLLDLEYFEQPSQHVPM